MTPQFAATLKRLEVAWRNAWIRALTRLMRSDPPPARPQWGSRPHRVLFLRHDRIGDMILSTGVLRAIAASHRTIQLDVLASPGNAPVLARNPHLHDVLVFDRTKPSRYLATLRTLRRVRYDAVIDCMPTAPSLTTLLLMWASGAKHRIGVAGRGNDAAITLPVSPRRDAVHVVDQLGALIDAFGVDPSTTSLRPEIHLDEHEQERARAVWTDGVPRASGRRLLVNISVGRAFRRWPDDRFAAAIRHARAQDPHLTITVIGAPDDSERAIVIARETGVRFEPTPTLREALALVATADFLFTPDTGVAHAASAFERPAVVMYIHGTAKQWGLYDSPGYPLSSRDGSLASLELEPVLRALDRMLSDPPPVRPRPIPGAEIGQFVR